MAKWGEGDPRWIVEERADATNVNNWHWTEKNASTWSKEKLTNLLMFLQVGDEKGSCEICQVDTIDGEASVNNRKAKLIFFYEWVLKLEWKGKLTDCETELKGQIEIPNLSDENDASEVDIIITTKTNTEESRTLKNIMLMKGRDLIRKQLELYITALKAEFSVGMILPTDKKNLSPATQRSVPKISPLPSTKNSVNNKIQAMRDLRIDVQIETSKITTTEKFQCSVEDLYEVLTDPKKIEVFTRSSVKMDVEKGGKFSLFGGNVTGYFDHLDKHKKIVQRWRFSSWPDAHFSVVTMEFTQEPSGEAVLEFCQTGVPNNELERTKEGWKDNFWLQIRQTFGFGLHLF